MPSSRVGLGQINMRLHALQVFTSLPSLLLTYPILHFSALPNPTISTLPIHGSMPIYICA